MVALLGSLGTLGGVLIFFALVLSGLVMPFMIIMASWNIRKIARTLERIDNTLEATPGRVRTSPLSF